MTPEEFERIVRSRAARIAVVPSAVRGRGNKGTVAAARAYLRDLDLRCFATSSPEAFLGALNDATDRLQRALPPAARHWGVARKVLNIFLRDCLYTTYLSHFALSKAESFLELPLDSVTAHQLKKAVGRGALPPWPGVKRVTPGLNRLFQSAALQIAKTKGVHRVHLDALWWSFSRDDANSPGVGD